MSGVCPAETENGGGYDLSFMDPPDDLLCMICHHVAKEAHQVECCGKVFCETCIKKTKERIGSCPNCRAAESSKFKIFCDRMSGRRIKHLKLSCENEDRGCDWSGILDEYDAHVAECGFVVVDCPSDGCTDKILKKFLHEHLSLACRRRLVECPVCKEKVINEEMQSHPAKCPDVEIKCTNIGCSTKIYRRQQVAHENVCSKAVISCPYSVVGCDYPMYRKDLQKHLRERADRHHLEATDMADLLRKKIALVREDIAFKSSPPYTFKMIGYERMKEHRQKWTSPAFYSQPGGYKMRMTVHPGGLGDVKDCLSLYISVIPGHQDGELYWPFVAIVGVQLLNQVENKEHYSKFLRLVAAMAPVDEEEECNRRGISDFIAHDRLEKKTRTCLYVDGGCVYFRISEVTIRSVCCPWLISFPSYNLEDVF